MFNLIGALISGLFVGALARWFYPGTVGMDWWLTSLLGVGGALVAGVLGTLGTGASLREGFSRAGCLGSILGAMALIFLGRQLGWGF